MPGLSSGSLEVRTSVSQHIFNFSSFHSKMITMRKIICKNMMFSICSLLLILGCASAPEAPVAQAPVDAENLFRNEAFKEFNSKISIIEGSRQLKTIDLDQMNDKISEYIIAYRRTQDSTFLYRALILTFSRPDEDSVRDKVMTQLRGPIDENGEWQSGLVKMAMQAIYTINDESATAQEQMTSGVILENILEEMLPDFRRQSEIGGFESNMIYSIAQSEMTYSDKALKERKLALMKLVNTPNKIAQRLLSAPR